MDLTTFIMIIILFYCMLFFMDYFLKSCINVPYLLFLENLGLVVQPFNISIFSTIFNRPITRVALLYKKFLNFWFSFGTIVVMFLFIPSILLLVINLVSQFSTSSTTGENVLQPVVPGLNLPMNEMPYYFTSLLIVTLFHEIGHAMAAVGEDIRINGVGFLVLLVLPGAFVDLPKEDMEKLKPFKRLKILCAGVWHNIVLVLIAFGIGTCLPTILEMFYSTNSGILVLDVGEKSPGRGPRGFNPDDIIEKVNYHNVNTHNDWTNHLVKIARENHVGFCVSKNFITNNDATVAHAFVEEDNVIKCCENDSESDELCFKLRTDEKEDIGEVAMLPYSCLPARSFMEKSSDTCVTTSDCKNEDSYCFAPSIEAGSRFLSISRRSYNGSPLMDVLYVGSVSELYFSITITDYVPKYSIYSRWFPHYIILLMDYIVKFSGALGLLNLIPCVYLDGYWIFKALLDFPFFQQLDNDLVKCFHAIGTACGSFLLAVTVLISVWSVF